MPMHAVFKSLVGREIRITLKNNVSLSGTLQDIDTFLNLKLSSLKVEHLPEDVYLPLMSATSVFLRGSAVKFIWIKEEDVHKDRLENTVRKTILYKTLLSTSQEKDGDIETG
ncbi:U6 snRNA-associated Sm-like protein LSm2 [Nematocida displodere]|uniref:U6 snRNA-associated Sm-like protein LSm2 n=1 Tax=Nematocida displodere TaxID=1805483 RepID=A0A177ECF0_9MICR|nr:U6 snRNA-associated Sm-like protein LSm2 [Nematocida displodere]